MTEAAEIHAIARSIEAVHSQPVADVSGLEGQIDRVVIIDDYTTARGGATGLALLSARLLRQRGLAVTYICGDHGDNAALAEAGVSVVGLGGADLLNAARGSAVLSGVHNQAAARLVHDWIATNDTPGTVYHVHGWSKILSPSIFQSLSPVADRCLVHAHDFFTACPNGAFFDYQQQTVCLKQPLTGACLATACDKRNYGHKLWRVARGYNVVRQLRQRHRFSRIVLLHEAMHAFFLRAGYSAERLLTIRNPTTALSSDRVKAEKNSEFVFIGRLDEEKGIAEAVQATKQAGVGLLVIGDGPQRANIEHEPHVRLLGWLPHEDIGQAIQSARALIMPSRYPEPFGMVAIEAAASGLPVILSQSAFLAPEMVRGGYALGCDVSDIRTFSAVIASMATMSSVDIQAMSQRAFMHAPALSHTQDGWCDALVGEYRRLAGARDTAGISPFAFKRRSAS